jgi:hypothetical protein
MERMKKSSFSTSLFRIKSLCAVFSLVFIGHAGVILKQYGSFRAVNDMVRSGNILWLATSGGVVEYDLSTSSYKTHAEISDIPDMNLTAAVKDPWGDLWFGSESGILVRLHPQTSAFTPDNSLAAADWKIRCMRMFGSTLMIGTSNGLSVYSIAKNSFQNVKQFGSFTSVDVSAIHIFGDTLAVVTTDGIASSVISDVEKTIFSNPKIWTCVSDPGAIGIVKQSDLLHTAYWKVFQSGNDVWQFGGTDTLAPNIYIPSTRLFFNSSILTGFPTPVTCVFPLDFPWVAVGTRGSFWYMMNQTTGASTKITINGPVDSDIKGCAIDKEGVLWYVVYDMTNGVGRYDGKTWESVTQGIGRLDGGPIVCKNSISVTTTDDIWVSTFPNGVKWYNRSAGIWSHYEDPFSQPPWGAGSTYVPEPSPLVRYDADTTLWWTFVSGSCEDSLGNIWVANNKAYNGDILHVRKPRVNVWRSFSLGDNDQFISSYTGPVAANQDMAAKRQYIYLGYTRKEDMLGGGMSILSYYGSSHDQNPTDPVSTATQVTCDSYRQSISVTGFAVANDTLVWVAAEDGIYRVTHNDVNTIVKMDGITSSDLFSAIAIGPDGRPVFCKDKDIYSYNDADSTLTNITRISSLCTPINWITLDKKNGTLWLASKKGLYRVETGMGSADQGDARSASIDAFPNPLSLAYLRNRHPFRFARLNLANPWVRIYDAAGNLVCTPVDKIPPGIINWYGKASNGKILAPGTYFYQANSANGKLCKGKIFIIP